MRKKGVALLALVLAGLVGAAGAAGASESTPAPPRPKPPRPNPPTPNGPDPEPEPSGPDPYYVGPGWFWWFCDWAKDGPAYVAFQTLNAGNLFVRKVLGHGTGYDVLVFEVVIEPVVWTLPGIPNPAPKRIDTELTDVESGPAPESSAWGDYLQSMGTQAVDVLKDYDRAFQEWLQQQRGWQ